MKIEGAKFGFARGERTYYLWADKNMVELLKANESFLVGFHSFASHGERNIRYPASNADY